ncbi:MAG: glycosyltransferase [Bacteroidota bacterium]
MKKLPISAVVVSCNEGDLLKECLENIQFCDELIVVDLNSTDNTVLVAAQYTNNVIFHKPVRVVEYVRAWIKDKVKYDWILFVDPDEVYPDSLRLEIEQLFEDGIEYNISGVELPWQFYFKQYPLKGTNWGGKQYKTALRHRYRNNFSEDVHRDMNSKDGYNLIRIEMNDRNAIKHKWMQSYVQLIQKHNRYIKEEGKSLFNCGKRYSLSEHAKEVYRAFRYSLVTKKGYLDGMIGLLLSLFWAWYNFKIWNSLKKYQSSI